MQLKRIQVGRWVAILMSGVVLAACSALTGQSSPSPASPQVSPNPSADARSTQIVTRDNSRAEAACSSILETIPMVIVRSGRATVAAAYEVTADELANYLEMRYSDNGLGGTSVWRDQKTKIVDMCIFDGDFLTMTPGPPEADRSAVRLLVIIFDAQPLLWSWATDKTKLPTIDPATIAA
ncbi:MAG: hypothetical protein ABI797_02105 [Chloroflexota bacterium]